MFKTVVFEATMPYETVERSYTLNITEDGRMQLWSDQGPEMTIAPMACGREGYALIKNYSENKGILDILIAEGIIEDTGETVPTGFVEFNKVKLL